MEIQDRNNLLQVLVGAKEGKMSFAFDKGSFVDILNSAQVDVEKSVKIADNADLGCGAKRDVVFEVKEKKETFVNNKATSKKVENKWNFPLFFHGIFLK